METASPKPHQKIILSGIALTTLLGAAALLFPVFGFVCFLMLPLPAFYYRMRLDIPQAALTSVGAFLILAVFAKAAAVDLFFLAAMLMLGVGMGECARRHLPVEKMIGYASGAVLAVGAFGLAVYANVSNTGLIRLISDYIGKNLELTLSVYETIGMPAENIALLSSAMPRIQYVLVRILPALCAAGLLFSAWLNLLLAKRLFRGDSRSDVLNQRLSAWKAPEFLVWGVAGGGLMLLAPSAPLKILGLNGLIVMTMIYFFQGIAIVAFYFEKKRVPRVLRVLIYGIIAIQQFFLLVIAGIGLFDVWLNFRRLDIEGEGQDPAV